MNPAAAAPTPIPIHDIVGPVWMLPYPLWLVITVAIGTLALLVLLGLLVAKLLRRRRPVTPRERALAELSALRDQIAGVEPYAFGVRVSDAIRTYIHAQHGLQATTQTSLEFLETIRHNPVFSDNEKSGLAVFLDATDRLKFARESAGENDMISLLETATRLVRGEVQSDPARP